MPGIGQEKIRLGLYRKVHFHEVLILFCVLYGDIIKKISQKCFIQSC